MIVFVCINILFLSRTSNFIDDEELSDLLEWKNPCFPYEYYSTFNLNQMSESEFRFGKKDIPMR